MRNATDDDAELLLRLYEIRRDPELRRARQWFLHEFKPGAWSEIKARYMTFQDEDRWFRMTTSYWEMVGAMVNRDVLHPELFFDHTGEDIVSWGAGSCGLRARAPTSPSALIQFSTAAAHLSTGRVNAEALAGCRGGGEGGGAAVAARPGAGREARAAEAKAAVAEVAAKRPAPAVKRAAEPVAARGAAPSRGSRRRP
jgi:hypothetical protein